MVRVLFFVFVFRERERTCVHAQAERGVKGNGERAWKRERNSDRFPAECWVWHRVHSQNEPWDLYMSQNQESAAQPTKPTRHYSWFMLYAT